MKVEDTGYNLENLSGWNMGLIELVWVVQAGALVNTPLVNN